MPVIPSFVELQLRSAGQSRQIEGPTFQTVFAPGVAQAVFSWAVGQQGNFSLTGQATGSAGVTGTVFGTLTVPNNPGAILSGFTAAGLTGVIAADLAQAVSSAISESFNNSVYQGTVFGVAAGPDVSFVTVSNPVTLQNLLQPILAGLAGAQGVILPQLALGLAVGITTQLLSGTGTGTVTGTPTFPQAVAAGVSNSLLVG